MPGTQVPFANYQLIREIKVSLFTSKAIRTGLTVVMAAGVLSTLSGCTDNEVVASALVIGAAAVISSDDNPPPRHWHHDGYGDGYGHDRYDRGGYGRGGYGGYDRGPGRDCDRHELAGAIQSSALDAATAQASAAATSTSAAAAAFKSNDARVKAFAQRYEVTDYAATYAVRAILLAQAKDTSGIEALGLSVGDMKDLYQGKKNLEAAKIETAAAKMKLTSAATAQLFADLQADTQAEKAARGL